MGLVEGFGTGIFRMRKYCREWGIVGPEFREDSGFFKTIFYKKQYEKKQLPSFDLSKLDEDDRKIIDYLQEHEKATAKELENVLKKSRSTLRRKLKNLMVEEYIVWKGKSSKDPLGYYELKNKI